MSTQSTDLVQQRLLQLLHYEEQLRTAENKEQLAFRAVNDCRSLINFRQAFIFYRNSNSFQLKSAANLANFDSDAPFVRWLENQAQEQQSQSDITSLDVNQLTTEQQQEWNEHALPHALWCPLLSPDKQLIGGIWFSRETPWQEEELAIIERVRSAVGYSVWACYKPKKIRKINRKKALYISLAILILSFIIPVRMSVLAPVEVVAYQPDIISSSVEGVIANIHVMPNQPVKQGQLLLSIDDTELRNQVTIAKQELEVKRAQLLTANQGAFRNRESKSSLAILREEINLATTKLDYYQERLNQASIRANKDGLLIYSDPSDWIGRPVQIGERIMIIANPTTARFRVDVPLADSLVLTPGSAVRVFLNANPLTPINAIIDSAAFKAEEVTAGQLAYRVIATADNETLNTDLRIGFRGTAKIYGERVPLFYYLFRRPLTSVRQYLGL